MQLGNTSPHGYPCPKGASSIWYIFATHQEQAAFLYLFDVLFQFNALDLNFNFYEK